MKRRFWLPTIAGYVLREFGRVLLMALSAFVILYLCIDFFERIPRFLEHDARVGLMATYFFLKLPLIISQIMPAAVLASLLLSLGNLARGSELLAMKGSGISLWQIGAPIILTCFGISLGLLAWNEFVVPPSAARSDYIETVEIKKRSYRSHFRHSRIWYQDRNGFTNIDRFAPKEAQIYGLTRYQFGKGFHLDRIVAARSARWDGAQWRARGAYEIMIDEGGNITTRTLAADGLNIEESPEDFSAVYRDAEDMSYRDLAQEIRELSSKGIDTNDSRVDLWLKIAVPFASVVMSLLAIPLASRHSRQSSTAANVGIALVVGFGYWVLLALTTSLAKGGVLPPPVAAWTANAVFATIGAIFFLGSD